MKTTITVNRATRAIGVVIALDGGEPNQPFKIDWGDGTAPASIASGGHAGPTNHTYAAGGVFSVVTSGNNLRTTDKVVVGEVLRAYDPQKFTKTPDQMKQREREKAAQIAGQVRSATHG
jgi:hypothetical protein